MSDLRNAEDMDYDLDGTIQALHRKGVHIWVENGVLRYRAPKGAITSADITVLRQFASRRSGVLFMQSHGNPFQPNLAGEARPKRAPLSFSQLAHLQSRAAAGYRPSRDVISVMRLCGALHANALKEALSVIIERHDSLRTNIISRNGEIFQEVAERATSILDVVDMTDVTPNERDNEMRKHVDSAITDVFDYAVDPLFKSVLLEFEDAERILILALDHTVSDGVSRSVLENELLAAYKQIISGRDVSLQKVQMQYADYAVWQQTVLAEYFKAQDSVPSAWRRTRFPEDARDQARSGLGKIEFTLDLRTRLALEELARRKGTTLVMIALTAYVSLVMRWCEAYDTVIQVMSNGRTSRVLENTVGYLAHPLYLHVSIGPNDTFSDLLEAITAEYCRACESPNFFYSYTLSPRPGFTWNTLFNWIPMSRGFADGHLETADDRIAISRVIYNPVLDLDVDFEPEIGFLDTGSDIAVVVVFPQTRFASSTMMRFSKTLGLFLDAIVACPGKCIREVIMA